MIYLALFTIPEKVQAVNVAPPFWQGISHYNAAGQNCQILTRESQRLSPKNKSLKRFKSSQVLRSGCVLKKDTNFLRRKEFMAYEEMELSTLQATLQREGARWQVGITPLSTLSDAEKRLHLGAVPPPGSPSLQEREKIARTKLEAERAVKA